MLSTRVLVMLLGSRTASREDFQWPLPFAATAATP